MRPAALMSLGALCCLAVFGSSWPSYLAVAVLLVGVAALRVAVAVREARRLGLPARTGARLAVAGVLAVRPAWPRVVIRTHYGQTVLCGRTSAEKREAARLRHPSVRAAYDPSGSADPATACESCGRRRALFSVAGAEVCQACAEDANPNGEFERRPLGWKPTEREEALWTAMEQLYRK
jgi:hypothetical protein